MSHDLPPEEPIADFSVGAARRIGSALTDAEGAPAGQREDHEAKGRKRLIRFFQSKPRIVALLAAFTRQVQDLENLAWAWYAESRDLNTAEGVLLDRLAAIVDEARGGRSDDELRAAVRVKIKILGSDGKMDQMVGIARLLLGESAAILASEHWPAGLAISTDTLNGLAAAYVARLLRLAKAGGVGLEFGVAGGPIGDVDGSPSGAAIGDTDGSPLGAAIGLVA